MINGKIIDQAHLIECLIDLRNRKPKLFTSPTLIVDGNSILFKKITVPKLNKRQNYDLIREEFANTSDNSEELVIDYHLLGNSKKSPVSILACAVDKVQVENYMSTFNEVGIKLGAIRIGMQAILNYISTRSDLKDESFVLNIIDGVTMLSMIFEKGVNVFISRTRLYSEVYDQYIQDILENLSGLIQFNRSEKFSDITHSFYLGIKDEDLRYARALNPYNEVSLNPIDIFSGSTEVKELPINIHFSYLNILLNKNSIDLIRSYKIFEKLKRRRKIKLWLPVFVGTVSGITLPILYLLIMISKLDDSIKPLKDYINNEDVIARSVAIDQILVETSYHFNIATQLENKIKFVNEKAVISNQVLNLITTTHNDKITVTHFDFNENTGIINVNGSSATETDSAEYIDILKRSDIIESVNYSGYSYGNDGRYNFSIAVKIAVNNNEDVQGAAEEDTEENVQ